MRIRFKHAVFEKDKAWIIPTNLSGIVEVDLNESRSRLITRMDGYELFVDMSHGPIQKNGDYIAAAPVMGEDFYLFNIRTNRLLKFSITEYIEKHSELNSNIGKFLASFCCGENIYFVGSGYPGIAKININSEQLAIIDIEENFHGWLGNSVGIFKNQVFIPIRNRKEFLVFDMDKEQYKLQEIGSYACLAVCCDENNMCLIPMENGNIEIYDIREQKLRKQIKLPDNCSGEAMACWYCSAVYHCGYVWIFPFKSNMILRLNLQTEETICVKKFDNISNIKYLKAGIYDENKVWGFHENENRLDIIDCQTFSMESIYIYPPNNINEFIDLENDLGSYMTEPIIEGYLNLEVLISYICKKEYQAANDEDMKCVGLDIWKELKMK